MPPKSPAIGCWLNLPSAQVAEIIGDTGFDFVVVDLEHGPSSIETAQLQMMALRASQALAIVRVPEGTEGWIKRALDAGAGGVMVPRVDSAAQAAAIVGFARYAPHGARGEALRVVRAARWGRDPQGYKSRWQDKPFISVQIETATALAAIEAIASVPGVTQLFFGPADYSASIGKPISDPAVIAAAKQVAKVAKAHGLDAGSVTFPDGTVGALTKLGFTHISPAGDIGALCEGLDATLAAARRAVDDPKG